MKKKTVFLWFTAFLLYFGAMLLPRQWPSIGMTTVAFLYVLSVPMVLLVLLVIAIAGLVGAAYSRTNRAFYRQVLTIAAVGILVFIATTGLANLIDGELPTGSRTMTFNTATWKDPHSSEYVDGDITARQKMLADVVEEVLPGKSRVEIESLLGPSPPNPYFLASGRDLIYETGPERDSFFAIDSEWLLIWLDKNGHFERYAIYTD